MVTVVFQTNKCGSPSLCLFAYLHDAKNYTLWTSTSRGTNDHNTEICFRQPQQQHQTPLNAKSCNSHCKRIAFSANTILLLSACLCWLLQSKVAFAFTDPHASLFVLRPSAVWNNCCTVRPGSCRKQIPFTQVCGLALGGYDWFAGGQKERFT
jgi:hypothetical protein